MNYVDGRPDISVLLPADRDDPGRIIVRHEMDLSHYIDGIGPARRRAEGELGPSILLARGLPVHTPQHFARSLDAAERKKDRTYRCYGGRLPRIGSHHIASFRYGVTHAQAKQTLRDFATRLSDHFGVPLYGRIHNKNGAPDHAHFLIGTREVENGKLGAKVRALDAVSEKISGKGVDVGDGKLIGPSMEWIRSEWARYQREATGDLGIDHRSYSRRGLDIDPVKIVSRKRVDAEKRRGSNAWREERHLELEARRQSPDHQAKSAEASQARITTPHSTLAARAEAYDSRLNGGPLRQSSFTSRPIERDSASEARSSLRTETHPLCRDLHGTETISGKDPANHAAVTSNQSPPATELRLQGYILFARMKKAHRLTADRSGQIAAVVGMSVNVFEERAKRWEAEQAGKITNVSIAPELESLQLSWLAHDNEKRRTRLEEGSALDQEKTQTVRDQQAEMPAQTGANPDSPYLLVTQQSASGPSVVAKPTRASIVGSVPGTMHSPVSASSDTSDVEVSKSSTQNPGKPFRAPPGSNAERAASTPSAHVTSNGFGPASEVSPARDAPVGRLGEDPSAISEHAHSGLRVSKLDDEFSNAAELLDRVRFQAFETEVLKAFTHAKMPAPPPRGLHFNIALYLRASGHSYDEVKRIVALGALSPHSAIAEREREAIVRDVFSEKRLAWLEENPTVRKRATSIEESIQTQTFEQLRRDALEKLKADLDDVWIQRRVQADAARRRHEKRMAFLFNQRWKLRQLRRRGLLALIMSVMVERLFLRRLIERQKTISAAEHQAIYARATELTAQMKARRDEFRRLKETERHSAHVNIAVKGSAAQREQEAVSSKSYAVHPSEKENRARAESLDQIVGPPIHGSSVEPVPKASATDHLQIQPDRSASTIKNGLAQTAGAQTLTGDGGSLTDKTGSALKQPAQSSLPTSSNRTENDHSASLNQEPRPAEMALSSSDARSRPVPVDAERRELAALYAVLLFCRKILTVEREDEIANLVGMSRVELTKARMGFVETRQINATKGDEMNRVLKSLSEEIYKRADQTGFANLLMLRKRIVAETKMSVPKSEKVGEKTDNGRGRS